MSAMENRGDDRKCHHHRGVRSAKQARCLALTKPLTAFPACRLEWKDPNDSPGGSFWRADWIYATRALKVLSAVCRLDLPRHLGQHSGGMAIRQTSLFCKAARSRLPGRVGNGTKRR